MSADKKSDFRKVILVGNPNTGKTTLFNKLCGLRQKTGNYPGVTVDKKRGTFKHNEQQIQLTDLPGIKSLFPKSKDEELVVKYLLEDKAHGADVVLLVMSALAMKKNLYLLDQVKDLELPLVVAITMADEATKRGISIDTEALSAELDVPVFMLSSKSGDGIQELKDALLKDQLVTKSGKNFVQDDDYSICDRFDGESSSYNAYTNFLHLTQSLNHDLEAVEKRQKFIEKEAVNITELRRNEAILRYKHIQTYYANCVQKNDDEAVDFTSRLDRILVHPIWGYVIFFFLMFLLFQSIFWLASYPMDWIDAGFSAMAESVNDSMSPGYFTDLIAEGVIPGIGGVVIFIPQIAILFLLFSLLEESGYMSRIVFLSDRFMRNFGMSGRSVIPMISGLACAVPAIMSARTIENKRNRLITILITPLLTCSARLPVYVILIGLIVPDETIGILNYQGIALMAMYLLGIVMALIAGLVFKFVLKSEYKAYLVLEMPEYLMPNIKNVLLSMWTNVKSFVWNAGKIILATSVILFVLATNGGQNFENAELIVAEDNAGLSDEDLQAEVTAFQLENSYLGMIGKSIEPAILPLGYDWKIGIAVISSLAAREVFVGTISTIYSINSEDELTIQERLRVEKNAATGLSAFNFATCVSLLLFYAFSLQCLSTVAVTYKETGSLKWTIIQFAYMSILGYISALIAYQILS